MSGQSNLESHIHPSNCRESFDSSLILLFILHHRSEGLNFSKVSGKKVERKRSRNEASFSVALTHRDSFCIKDKGVIFFSKILGKIGVLLASI